MSGKINLLADKVVNKIAAGEIILRPANAVKEILENSVDAKSTLIQVWVVDGGKTQIKVIDNGEGMHAVDAPRCFQRHATSKIKRASDLTKLYTYGFRGEGLSAIGAVAEVELITRIGEEALATRVVYGESQLIKEEKVAAPVGTQIAVNFLFRDLPVRRWAMKSNHIELKHIIDEVQRAALARNDISFSLHHNGEEIYQLPAAKRSHRIVQVLGKHYQKKLVPCEGKLGSVSITGYIGTPAGAKKTRGGQFFFVNQRYIKSTYLHHAVKQAFEHLIPPNTFPFYVLFIHLPVDEVDVNIHPTKTEVGFKHERMIYALLSTSVKKALATHQCVHMIDFEQPPTEVLFVPPEAAAPATPPVMMSAASTTVPDRGMSYVSEKAQQPEGGGIASRGATDSRPTTLPLAAKLPLKTSPFTKMPAKMQLHRTYLLVQVKSGLLVINQKLAYQRIFYERNLRSIAGGQATTQQLIFPHVISLQPADIALIQACQEDIRALGFSFHLRDQDKVVITGEPPYLHASTSAKGGLMLDLLEQYKKNSQELTISQQENWALSLAKRSAGMLGGHLLLEEMEGLVDQLFACREANHTPDGKLIWRTLTLEDLQALIEGVFSF
ncbi:MAG: DNA mismatch repair endonuclease MutL [Cytophagales bacterium]